MKTILRILIISILIAFGPGISGTGGQIFSDSASLYLIKDGADTLYNFQFREAEIGRAHV